jgi:hypothetical protein
MLRRSGAHIHATNCEMGECTAKGGLGKCGQRVADKASGDGIGRISLTHSRFNVIKERSLHQTEGRFSNRYVMKWLSL